MNALPQLKAVTIASMVSLATGMIVIIGWKFHPLYIPAVFPEYLAMKFNAALCFMLLGAAMLLTQFPLKKYAVIAFFFFATLIIGIGAVSVLQRLFHFNTGLDELFIADKTATAGKYSFPGRMAANAAICFVLFGLAFFGFCTKSRLLVVLSQYLLHAVTIISAISIIGRLYGLSLFYNDYFANSMAMHTAVLFFLLSAVASLLHPTLGITALFTGTLVGNAVARRVFLLLVSTILVFGGLRAGSLHYGLFSQQTGIVLLIICFICLSLALIWNTVNWLNKFDVRRRDAENMVHRLNDRLEKRVAERSAHLLKLVAKFKESESKFRTAFEHSAMGMALVSLKGKWMKVNKRLCDMVGYREQELLTLSFHDLTHPDDNLAHLEVMDTSKRPGDEAHRIEKRYVCKNGSTVWVSINIAAVTNKKGAALYFVSQFEDITERKKAEQRLKHAYKKIHEQVTSIQAIAWKQSHLMRKPLANLKGLMEILKDDTSDKETIAYMQEQLERLDTVVVEMAEDACCSRVAGIAVKQRHLQSPFKTTRSTPLIAKKPAI